MWVLLCNLYLYFKTEKLKILVINRYPLHWSLEILILIDET